MGACHSGSARRVIGSTAGAGYFRTMTGEPTTEPKSDVLCFSIRRTATIYFRLYIAVMAAVQLLILVAILVSRQGPLVERLGIAVAWILVLIPLFTWMKRRLLDAVVKASPDGLQIYNGLKRHVVRWDDVAGFEPSSRPFLFAVRRVSGGSVTMDGITPETFGGSRPTEGSDRRT